MSMQQPSMAAKKYFPQKLASYQNNPYLCAKEPTQANNNNTHPYEKDPANFARPLHHAVHDIYASPC
jgi:hypothetical protein